MHGWDRRHNTSRAKRLTWRQRQWTVRHAALPRRTCPWPAACKWAGVSSQSPATETLPSPCQEQYSRDCLGAGMKSQAVQCDHGREHAAPWRTLTASSLLVQRSTPAISPPLNRSGADGIAPAFMFHDAVGAAAAFMFNDAAGAAASATSSSAAHSVRRAILSLSRFAKSCIFWQDPSWSSRDTNRTSRLGCQNTGLFAQTSLLVWCGVQRRGRGTSD